MNVSPLSLVIGVALVLLYAIVDIIRNKRPPNLGALFVLFMSGPVVDEALSVITITHRLVVEKQQIEAGVFKNHIFVIAFTAVALIYAVLDSVYANFRHFFKSNVDAGAKP